MPDIWLLSLCAVTGAGIVPDGASLKPIPHRPPSLARCMGMTPFQTLVMSFTAGFNTACDLLEKRERDAGLLLDDAVTADRFMNFILTG